MIDDSSGSRATHDFDISDVLHEARDRVSTLISIDDSSESRATRTSDVLPTDRVIGSTYGKGTSCVPCLR